MPSNSLKRLFFSLFYTLLQNYTTAQKIGPSSVTITSKNCASLMYFSGMQINGANSSVTEVGNDVCEIRGGNRIFTVGTEQNGQMVLEFVMVYGGYSLPNIKIGSQTYTAVNGHKSKYTHKPSGPLNTAYACSLTTFKNLQKGENLDKTITFKEFSVQLNKCPQTPQSSDTGSSATQTDCSGVATFSDYSHINNCIGFLSTETILGLVTILLVFGISMFGAYVLASVDTMDKFEDPKMRPLQVPLDAK